MEALNRDARRLVPRSLARLLGEREAQVLRGSAPLPAGAVRRRWPPTSRRAGCAPRPWPPSMPRPPGRRAAPGAAGHRGAGAPGRPHAHPRRPGRSRALRGPRGLSRRASSREYYAFVDASLDKIPVVLDDRPALQPRRARTCRRTGRASSAAAARSRRVIRAELFRNGRVVDHRTIDYRSPVFGVASLSYSRAVTAIAATWLAVWRDAARRHHADAEAAPDGAPRRRRAAPRRNGPRRPSPSAGGTMTVKRAPPLRLPQGRHRGAWRAALVERGFEIVSTGGTAAELAQGQGAGARGLEGHRASRRSSTAA